MKSNMRNLPEDQNLEGSSQPTVVKGKLYAATKGQQDQLAEFAATIGAPVPEEHRKENKGLKVPVGPVDATSVAQEYVPKAEQPGVEVVVMVDGAVVEGDASAIPAPAAPVEEAPVKKPRARRKAVGVPIEDVLPQVELPNDPELEARLDASLEKVRKRGGKPVATETPYGDAFTSSERNADEGTEAAPEIVNTEERISMPQIDAEGFTGFEIPEGDYYAMLMLHPPRDADGKVGEVPQIQIGTTKEAWKSWVRLAVQHGLTQGFVHADDGVTELTGFSAMVISPGGDEKKRLGFVFKQVAAIIPFRDVDDLMLRREKINADRKAAAAKAKKAKTKQRKQQAKSRRNNR